MWNDGVFEAARTSGVGRRYLDDPRGIGRRNGVRCSMLGREGERVERKENESGWKRVGGKARDVGVHGILSEVSIVERVGSGRDRGSANTRPEPHLTRDFTACLFSCYYIWLASLRGLPVWVYALFVLRLCCPMPSTYSSLCHDGSEFTEIEERADQRALRALISTNTQQESKASVLQLHVHLPFIWWLTHYSGCPTIRTASSYIPPL